MAPVTSLMTVKEAAARLSQLRGVKVSTQSVYRMANAKAHRLPTIRVGRSLFVANLDEWLAAEAAASVSPPLPADGESSRHLQAKRVRNRKSINLNPGRSTKRYFGTPDPKHRKG